ncbi:MAG: Hpt domain-containing protein, partial [Pseudobdellovibrionaceae bacterium]|nr:Hpt domain-containing protein [Pseudobdellovibrionaceae bacterium]
MLRFWLILIMICGSSLLEAAVQPLDLAAYRDGMYLGPHLTICPESSVPGSIEEIHQKWDSLGCSDEGTEIPFLTLGEGSYWFRLQIHHAGTEPIAMVLENNWPSDFVRMVQILPSSDQSFGNDVDRTPFILHRYAAHRLLFYPGTQSIYIHMKHTGSVRLPLRLWSEQSFQHNKYKEDVAASILVGVTLAMMLYNIFLLVTFRFKQQIYYAGFLIATLWYLIFWSGFSQSIPTPWRLLFTKTWMASACFMCVFLCHFTIQFLHLHANSPRLTRTFRIFSWAFIATALVGFASRAVSFQFFSLLLTPFTLLCMGAGFRGVWQRGRPAIFYLVSFLLIILGGTLENSIALGLVDPKWSFWPFFAASNLQSILLSLGIGDKLHLDQKSAHNKIVTLNADLQQHVHHVNELVDRKTREIRSIMTNLPQGLLMIQKDLTIHRDFSSFCTQLFEQNDLHGRDALAIVFHGTQWGADRMAQLHSALQACLGEPELAFQLNEDCFPLEVRRQSRRGEQQTLEMGWYPILDTEGHIEYILLSVRDVTSLRTLQVQSDKQMQRLELISEIITIDHTAFLRFMKSCRAFQAENQRLIQNLKEYDPEINKILFINLHTMKGLARSLHLNKIADIYHNIEHHLADLRMGQVGFSRDRLLQSVHDIDNQLDTYETVCSKDLGRSMQIHEHALLPMKDLEPLVQRIDRLDINNSHETKNFVADIRQLFTQLYY